MGCCCSDQPSNKEFSNLEYENKMIQSKNLEIENEKEENDEYLNLIFFDLQLEQKRLLMINDKLEILAKWFKDNWSQNVAYLNFKKKLLCNEYEAKIEELIQIFEINKNEKDLLYKKANTLLEDIRFCFSENWEHLKENELEEYFQKYLSLSPNLLNKKWTKFLTENKIK